MMRVLVLQEACGGVARHVADLCAGLLRHGIDVHLLYSPRRADGVLRSGLQRLSALGVPITAIDMGPAPQLQDMAALAAIRRYLRRHGPFDILHGHSSKAGALARLVPCGDCRARVYTPHAFVTMNPELGVMKRRFYQRVERWLSRFGDAVIATSTAEYEHARAVLDIPAHKLTLIPNGIDPDIPGDSGGRKALREAWGVGDAEVVIGTVVRLAPQKAPGLLLRAFAAAGTSGGNCRLVFAGDGPLSRELASEASRLGLAGSVVWPGFVDGPRVMAAFDLFVLSSCYEGFPYVFLEALAAGLPIVTTAVGGADMAVKHGENGFMLSIGDEAGLSGALSRLLADPDERRRMGRASLAHAQNFHVDRMVDDTLAVYDRLLTAPKPCPSLPPRRFP